MGWNQKRAHFYAEIESARTRTETILSDAQNGFRATFAGEYGSIIVQLEGKRSHWDSDDRKQHDNFYVWFAPWRESETSEHGRKTPYLLCSGRLNFDAFVKDETVVTFGKEAYEKWATKKALEALLPKEE